MAVDRHTTAERLMTSREVAELLRVSVRYIQRQVAEGRLGAFALQTGSRATLRFREAEVEAWVARYVAKRNCDLDIR